MTFPRVHHTFACCAAALSCAALLAWPQTAAADDGSDHGSGQEQVSVHQGDNQNHHGGGDRQSSGGGGDHRSSDGGGESKPAKHADVPKLHDSERAAPAPAHTPPHPRAPVTHRAAAPTAPAATAGGAVPSAATTTAPDPAPFSPSADLSRLAAQPVEALGSLTGISFGGGVVLWPMLVVLDLLGFALIIRGQLRRRRAPAEE